MLIGILSHIIPYYPILSHIIPYWTHIIPYYPILNHIKSYYPILNQYQTILSHSPATATPIFPTSDCSRHIRRSHPCHSALCRQLFQSGHPILTTMWWYETSVIFCVVEQFNICETKGDMKLYISSLMFLNFMATPKSSNGTCHYHPSMWGPPLLETPLLVLTCLDHHGNTPCPARIVAPHSAQATSTLLRRFMEASLMRMALDGIVVEV